LEGKAAVMEVDGTALADAFAANFCKRGELGASVAVFDDGEMRVELADGWCERDRGRPWTAETLVPVYSASKGPAAASVLLATHESGLDIESPLVRFWPEFGQPMLTIGEVLSHQAGLAGLDESVDVHDYEAVVEALSHQTPAWGPPVHGYHPRTYGFLLDEIVRRLTSAPSLGHYWRERIAKPEELDIWFGLPESEDSRVATLYAGKMEPSEQEASFRKAYADPRSETRKAFESPSGLSGTAEMNRPTTRRLGLPAFGALASARGLGCFYGRLAAGSLFPERVDRWMRQRLVNGQDRILRLPTSFSAGFMLDPVDGSGRKVRSLFGRSLEGFGHPGAGGCHAFAEPERGLGFAYVMNQMEFGVLPGSKANALVKAALG